MQYKMLKKVSYCWILLCLAITTYGQTDCVADLVITDAVTSGQTSDQMVSNSISASNTIANGATANYQAGSFVLLTPGFQATEGSNTSITIAPCTGTSNARATSQTVELTNETLDISLYPNPTGGSFTVQIPAIKSTGLQLVEVYNLAGVLVYKKSVSAGEQVSIDLKNHTKGLYLVKYFLGKQGITKRVLYK
ncbi:hypothetical protein BKI52_23680 [marine bacterium AO1-C]|nr:hypothetical protein BKI52_23680 [marine bacterium AO1-C]